MAERPILFSGAMVRAIMEGRKTMTRRVVTPQPNSGPNGKMVELGGAWGLLDGILAGEWCCPYGVPGDRLWVRESFTFTDSAPYADGKQDRVTLYAADDPAISYEFKCRPSIHMPRSLSRLTLEILNVRVERLQEISDADCIAEGVQDYNGNYFAPEEAPMLTDKGMVRGDFRVLWDIINAKRAPWASNPWVWCVEFRKVEPPPMTARNDSITTDAQMTMNCEPGNG